VQTHSRLDHLWVRLLDVQASLSARSYSAPGRVVFEVEDTMYERVSRLAVEGDASGGSAEATQDEVEIAIGVGDLGAAYLGGVSFASLARSGRLVERVPGSVRRADAMFWINPQPYLTTNF
jgi:predicted acetyltransferase